MISRTRTALLLRLNRIKLLGVLLIVATALVIIMAVDNMLVSSVFAFVISYLFGPLVNYLEREGVHRVVATSITFIATGIVLGVTGFFLFPYIGAHLNAIQSDMPKYIEGVGRVLADSESRLQSILGPMYSLDLTDRVQNQLTEWSRAFFVKVPSLIGRSMTVLMLGPFLAFFMVKDGRHISRTLLSLVPNNIFEIALSLQHQINDQMAQFVRARLLEAAIVGAVTGLGLWIIGFPFALGLAFFAGITNLIPYIGPIIGAAPALLIALIAGHSGLELFLVFFVYLIAQLIDAVFIIPLVVAKIVDLHPVTVIVVIIIGAQLMGVVGMLISIPVASVIKVTISTVYNHLTDFRV